MKDEPKTKKSLGQNWLRDSEVLSDIAKSAELSKDDFVLEIGPGLGTLTRVLQKNTKKVIAIEFDKELFMLLEKNKDFENTDFYNEDFLNFNLDLLPKNYKVVANVPYYITSKIIQKLLTAKNKPQKIVLLVQKEVAERIAAGVGDYSVLALSAQLYASVKLGRIVEAKYFEPAPKVDSQVVILDVKKDIKIADEKTLFRVIKAGFANRRKKLRSSLSAGLHISKTEVEELLNSININANLRAQDLSLDDWQKLAEIFRR